MRALRRCDGEDGRSRAAVAIAMVRASLANGPRVAMLRIMRLVSLSAFVLGVLVLAGCPQLFNGIEKPQVKVRSGSLSTAGLGGVTGQLDLDVTNPNGFGVPLSGVDWQLSIGQTRAATGTVQLSQTIPAKAVAPVTTTLSVDARDAVAVVQQVAGGERNYRIVATLHFSTQLGAVDVTIEHTGTIDGALGVLQHVL